MTRIAGYTYKADNYCADHILKQLSSRLTAIKNSPQDAEDVLVLLGASEGIADIYDLYSYDSDNFPKMFFHDQVNSDITCGTCGDKLG